MCDQPASWIKMSHALWNGQNKLGSESGREKEEEWWRHWGERACILPQAYQVCWFYHRGSYLQSVHGLLRQQHISGALFFQVYWETFSNTLQAMARTLFTQFHYVVSISAKVQPKKNKTPAPAHFFQTNIYFLKMTFFDEMEKLLEGQG